MQNQSRSLNRIQSDLILLLAAAVWGSGFIAQRVAAQSLNVFFFNGFRFLLGAILLLPIIRFRLNIPKKAWRGAALAGLLLFSAGAFQQAGLRTTTAANAGFITGLYVVFVPFFLMIFWREKQRWSIWLAALIAVFGMLLLSTGGEFRLASGDLLEFIGAFLWALHVIIVGKSVENTPPLHFAIGQFFVCAALSLIAGFIIEPNGYQNALPVLWTIIYSSVAAVAIGFTLQAVGQKNAPPTDAALILSMESVFAALFGYLFLKEILSFEQLIGCALVMAAIVVAQLPFKKH